MKLIFAEDAWDDYLYWQQTEKTILERINTLIKDTKRSPFTGIGKPEPLRGNLKGTWSRRITGEHRLLYVVSGRGDSHSLEIVACRHHYD